jgi:hypothetical protein
VLRCETFRCGWILCGFFATGDAEVADAFLVKRSRPSTRRAARTSTCLMLSHFHRSLNVVSPNKSTAGPTVVMGVVWTLDKMSVCVSEIKKKTQKPFGTCVQHFLGYDNLQRPWALSEIALCRLGTHLQTSWSSWKSG